MTALSRPDVLSLPSTGLPLPSPVPDDAEVDAEVLREIPEEFSVDSAEGANWLVRKILDARNYAAAVQAWAAREQQRAEREEKSLLFLFGNQLRNWCRAEIAQRGGRRKSVPLPAGIVAFQQVAANLVVDDERAVLRWAKANCHKAVVVMERASKSVLKEHFAGTGEQPDGTHVEPLSERMYIRPAKSVGMPADEATPIGE